MTAVSIEGRDRPIRVVGDPPLTGTDSQHEQKYLLGRLLLARNAVLRTLQSGRKAAATVWGQLIDGRVVRFALRACSGTLSGLQRVTALASRPGVRPGLLWLASSRPGTALLVRVTRIAGRLAQVASRPLIGAARWVLGQTGAAGEGITGRVQRVLTTARTSFQTYVPAARQALEPLLQRDGLAMQSARSLLATRALSGLVRTVLPGRWALIVRAALNVALVPARLRRMAVGLTRGLFTSGPDDPTSPSPAAAKAPSPVVDLEHERDQRAAAAAGSIAVGEASPLPDPAPSLQRYPAKAGQKRKR